VEQATEQVSSMHDALAILTDDISPVAGSGA